MDTGSWQIRTGSLNASGTCAAHHPSTLSSTNGHSTRDAASDSINRFMTASPMNTCGSPKEIVTRSAESPNASHLTPLSLNSSVNSEVSYFTKDGAQGEEESEVPILNPERLIYQNTTPSIICSLWYKRKLLNVDFTVYLLNT